MTAALKLDEPIPFRLGPRAGTIVRVAKVDLEDLRRQVLKALRGHQPADVEDYFNEQCADRKFLATLDSAVNATGLMVTAIKRRLSSNTRKGARRSAIVPSSSKASKGKPRSAGTRLAEPSVPIDASTLYMVGKLRRVLESIEKGAAQGRAMTTSLQGAVRAAFRALVWERGLNPDQVAAVALDDVLEDVLEEDEDTDPRHLRSALAEHSDGTTALEVLAWYGVKRGAESVDDPDGNVDRALQYLADHAKVGGAGGRGVRGAKSINGAVLAVMNSMRKAWGLPQWRTPEAAGLRPRRRNSRR